MKLSNLTSQPLGHISLVASGYMRTDGSITTENLFLRSPDFFRTELQEKMPKSTDEVQGNFACDVYRVMTLLCHVHAPSGSQSRSVVCNSI